MSRELLKATISSAFSKASVRELEVQGVKLYIRGLSGGERVTLQQWASEASKGGEPLADYKVVSLGLCDAEGVRLFDDPLEVAKLDGAVLSQLSKAILEASLLTDNAVGDAEKK
jgi:hypothetical protein